MNARDAYMTALIRARRDRSLDGVLRSAEAFRELDDRTVVEQCLHIAAQLAAGTNKRSRACARLGTAGRPHGPRSLEEVGPCPHR